MSADDPIQNIDLFDLIGKRNDGGVDLVVVVSAPLSDSDRHRSLLAAKIEAYAHAIGAPQFRSELGIDGSSQFRILVVSDFPIEESIRGFIGSLEPIAEAVGATLSLSTSKQQWG